MGVRPDEIALVPSERHPVNWGLTEVFVTEAEEVEKTAPKEVVRPPKNGPKSRFPMSEKMCVKRPNFPKNFL